MSGKTKREARAARHRRVRKIIRGSAERPRIAVYRSLRHISAQVIDDLAGQTLCAVTTSSKQLAAQLGATGNVRAAAQAGKILGEKMKAAGISQAVFDRGGSLYHGRVKAFADGVREVGIKI